MNQPKIFSESGWRQSWIELSVLFALTMLGATVILDMHWTVAMTVTPVIMFAMLLAVMVFVQALWLFVIGLERIGTAAGLRKSPFS